MELLSVKKNKDHEEVRRVYRVDDFVFVVDRFPNAKNMQYLEKLTTIDHPSIVAPTSLSYDGKQSIAVYPYKTGKMLVNIDPISISRQVAKNITMQLTSGVAALHRAGFVHLDVHERNCLYDDKTDMLYILDYEYMQEPGVFPRQLKRANHWQPPEWGKTCTYSTDVYAIAMTLRDRFYMINAGQKQWFAMAEVPDHIEPILKRALSPEQNLRHKDAQMLLEELVF